MDWAKRRRKTAVTETPLRLNPQNLLPGMVIVDSISGLNRCRWQIAVFSKQIQADTHDAVGKQRA